METTNQPESEVLTPDRVFAVSPNASMNDPFRDLVEAPSDRSQLDRRTRWTATALLVLATIVAVVVASVVAVAAVVIAAIVFAAGLIARLAVAIGVRNHPTGQSEER